MRDLVGVIKVDQHLELSTINRGLMHKFMIDIRSTNMPYIKSIGQKLKKITKVCLLQNARSKTAYLMSEDNRLSHLRKLKTKRILC